MNEQAAPEGRGEPNTEPGYGAQDPATEIDSLPEHLRVLLIDREEGFTRAVKAALDSQTYRERGKLYRFSIDGINHPEEALLHLHTQGYEVVLYDLGFSEMDGGDFVRKARSHGSNAAVGFLCSISDGFVSRLIHGGFYFLAKPVAREQLVEFIVRLYREKA